MSLRAVCLAALVLGSIAAAWPAQAQPAGEARTHFSRGQRFYEVGDFAAALTEFKASYLANDDPVLLFNMAQCQRQLGQAADAIRLYRNYLRRKPDAPNRAEVERRIEELRAAAPATTPGAPPTSPPLGTPAPATSMPAAAPAATLVDTRRDQPPPPEDRAPFYGRWWFWAAAAGVAALGTAAVVTLGRGGARPACVTPYDCK